MEGMAYYDDLLYASETKGNKSSKLFSMTLNGDEMKYIGDIGFAQVEAMTFVNGSLYTNFG